MVRHEGGRCFDYGLGEAKVFVAILRDKKGREKKGQGERKLRVQFVFVHFERCFKQSSSLLIHSFYISLNEEEALTVKNSKNKGKLHH